MRGSSALLSACRWFILRLFHDAIINPQCLKLPISQTNFPGPKDVRAIEVRLYFDLDEEYARRLQEEQDLSDMRSTKRPTPSVPRREPVKPLAEIMQEEMTKQSMREELVSFSQSSQVISNSSPLMSSVLLISHDFVIFTMLCPALSH